MLQSKTWTKCVPTSPSLGHAEVRFLGGVYMFALAVGILMQKYNGMYKVFFLDKYQVYDSRR